MDRRAININRLLMVLICGLFSLNHRVCADDGLQKPVFSKERGFYENVFDLSITTDADETIKYTLDGSDPRFSPSVLISPSPLKLTINPEDTTNRYLAPAVVVRAAACKDDTLYSQVETQTFLYINKVVELSPEGVKPGQGWPDPNDRGSGHYYDYGLDPDVLNDPRYQGKLPKALFSIPSLSFVTDLKNLFDPVTGIYEKPNNRGREWERPTSVELLNPDGSPGFQIDAGLRIRGGYSRRNVNPKHAFRLFFRSDYGAPKLDYPLFGDEGVNQFDKIDIRTSQNYSWSYDASDNAFNTMNRDVFSRDLQHEIGQPYTRSRYYHLYINGVYWGLFQSQERPEARYAASYFGGSNEDYDVVKVDAGSQRPYSLEATDGSLEAWEEVWQMCQAGFRENDNYFNLIGYQADGTRNPEANALIDIDNLIDYMLVIFYTGDFDAPVSKFLQNKSPNNFYAIYNRNSRNGFIFFAHDCEHTLFTMSVGPSIGLYENRVNIGNIPDQYYRMIVNNFDKFHPQWLHHCLSENAEYRMRFADHVYKYFFNDGAMTPEPCIKRFMERADEIDMAIVAESARWGDAQVAKPRTKDDDWLPVIENIIDNFFPFRTEIVLNQLKAENLYPDVAPPIYMAEGFEISQGEFYVEPGYKLTILKPDSTGVIVFTTDGKDPRSVGGNIVTTANVNEVMAEITISTTSVVKARILDGDNWSALNTIAFSVSENLSNIKITEIHYHPIDFGVISGSELEFIELKNIGSTSLNLSLAKFSEGIDYTFPVPTYLDAGEFIVLASNKRQFNNRYKMEAFGEYTGQLDNAGERITLLNAAEDTIFTLRYNDKSPWPTAADTLGYSLVSVDTNPTSDPGSPTYWRASYSVNGSPGSDDFETMVGQNNIILKSRFALYQNFPNPFNPETTIRFFLPKDAKVTLKIFDVLGQEVQTLIDQRLTQGDHRINWHAANVAGGIYFYRLEADGLYSEIKKLVYLK